MHISILEEERLQVQDPGLDALQEAAQRAAAPLWSEKLDVRVDGDWPRSGLALQGCCPMVVGVVPAQARLSLLKLRCEGWECIPSSILLAEILCAKEREAQAGVLG